MRFVVIDTEGREYCDIHGDSDTVDSIHAATTPTANKLLAMNANAKFPTHTIEGSLTVETGLNVGGNVGIGTTPDHKLHVFGNAANWITAFANDGNNVNRSGIAIVCGTDDAAGNNQVLGAYDGSETIQGYLTIDDGVFELNQGSDLRRKKNVVAAWDVLDELRQVEIIEYSFKKKAPGVRHVGFCAQQLHEHFPKIAKHDEKTDWWGVTITRMIPINTKAIQEVDGLLTSYQLVADAEREATRAEIAGLQKRLAVLELA